MPDTSPFVIDDEIKTYESLITMEAAVLAKYAFTLAQSFNNFYHRHNILKETDGVRKALLLATAAVARRELVRVAGRAQHAVARPQRSARR